MKHTDGLHISYFYAIIAGLFVSLLVIASVNTVISLSTPSSNSDLVLPGSSIESTVFSNITSDNLDQCVFNGTWKHVSNEPYLMNLTLPENKVNVSQAHQVCENFLGSDLYALLSFDSYLTPVDNQTHLWGLAFSYSANTSAFAANIWINAISGKVCAYAEHASSTQWFKEHNLIDPSLNPTDTDPNYVDSIALEFLQVHNYTILPEARHIRTHTVESSTESILYEVEIAIPNQGIFSSRLLSGVILIVDSSISRVISLSYTYIRLPMIDLSSVKLCSSEDARAFASRFVSPSKIQWEGTYLRMIPKTPLFVDEMQFQLAFGFEFIHANNEIDEIQVDAITGQYSDLYTGIVLHRYDTSFGVLMFSLSCVGFSVTICFASRFLIQRNRRP
ncbi:MAG: hypothetical protein JW779_12230 [Candidatus Thorarchaeota archaeon]|nr:hypothetical protein [Candidatus Thorarchaeota archaeon]